MISNIPTKDSIRQSVVQAGMGHGESDGWQQGSKVSSIMSQFTTQVEFWDSGTG